MAGCSCPWRLYCCQPRRLLGVLDEQFTQIYQASCHIHARDAVDASIQHGIFLPGQPGIAWACPEQIHPGISTERCCGCTKQAAHSCRSFANAPQGYLQPLLASLLLLARTCKINKKKRIPPSPWSKQQRYRASMPFLLQRHIRVQWRLYLPPPCVCMHPNV